MTRSWRRVLYGVLVLSLLFAAGPSRTWALELDEEKELGRKILQMVRDHFRLIEDPEVVGYVQAVGRRVVRALGPVHYDYAFFVIDDATPNAFAIPGGYVFVFRGLLELMDSEAELASILAHELAHVQSRHIHKQLERGRILSIAGIVGTLAGAFLGLESDAARALAMGTMAGAQTLQLKYSREDEEEADRLGFEYLVSAGYEPRAMVTVMQKMRRMNWQSDSRVPSYLMTHPAMGERVGYLELLVERKGARPSSAKVRDALGDYPFVLAILLSRHAEFGEAQRRFQGWLQDPARKAAALYGLGRIHLSKGRLDEALNLLRQAAVLKPMSHLVLTGLGETYHRLGRLEEAEKALRSALALDDESPMAHLRLGLVYQDQEKWQEALRHLKRAEALAPLNPELDYQLGVVYGRMQDLGPAHYYLARHAMRRGDAKLVAFHMQKAKIYLPASDDRLRELERWLKESRKTSRGS
ncbi:M48 family metallopeptidase [Desulfosoma caldarium]|uniref:Putative Zn-dependent protease n=1 Tax=Desulfosoma caldarium TaxID=610254 RepID=A0A3N1UI74_9BACT|nr:M48 family metallopeptidase [Desulfosoma caldarium]ROQ90962.1 putative Zn-dependent protease [Desulfosoma caldarium]